MAKETQKIASRWDDLPEKIKKECGKKIFNGVIVGVNFTKIDKGLIVKEFPFGIKEMRKGKQRKKDK